MTAKANMDNKPTARPRFSEFADKLEYVSKAAAGRMYDRMKAFRKVLGDRPYKALPVDEKELVSRYIQVRHDPFAWKTIIEQNIKVKQDGTVLLPKKFITSLTQTERKLRDEGL